MKLFRSWNRRPSGEQATSAVAVNRSSLPSGFTSEEVAREQILDGRAPEGLWTGLLKFEREPRLVRLPAELTAASVRVSDCPNFRGLPPGLWAGTIMVRNCPAFQEIPATVSFDQLEIIDHAGDVRIGRAASLGSLRLTNFSGTLLTSGILTCKNLAWPESPLQVFPDNIRVAGALDLRGSPGLMRLPLRMKLDALNVSRCRKLESLPDYLDARLLNVSGCTGLAWQESALVEVAQLNLADCVQITSLPWWLSVEDSIDVANTGLRELPESLRRLRLMWRGIQVDERIAFHPEQIKVEEIFAQRNAEVRRVMLERIGWERFFREAKPKLRDNDHDPGGERRLFHVSFPDREDVLVLNMSCPSTGRTYFIRVPPRVKTCHEAAAWIAGFDDPAQYDPIIQT